jgi:hypothetical protein
VATNFYFNNFPANHITQEQLLVEDLVIEAMQIHGMDVYYLPKSNESETDYLFGDEPLKQFTRAHSIEMYLENVTGMDGEGDFISKFGLEIRDEVQLLVSRRRFKFATAGSNLIRPREGDLVYIPLVENFFEITFVEHENDQAMFYTLGRGRGGNVYVYALKLKQFVFSNEIVETGIDEIDNQIRDSYAKTKINYYIGTGNYIKDEIVYQGTDLANATAQALVYQTSPHTASGVGNVDVYRVNGTFTSGLLKGATSNSIHTITLDSDISSLIPLDNPFEDIIDNNRIQTESDEILDWSEKNPFGEG